MSRGKLFAFDVKEKKKTIKCSPYFLVKLFLFFCFSSFALCDFEFFSSSFSQFLSNYVLSVRKLQHKLNTRKENSLLNFFFFHIAKILFEFPLRQTPSCRSSKRMKILGFQWENAWFFVHKALVVVVSFLGNSLSIFFIANYIRTSTQRRKALGRERENV